MASWPTIEGKYVDKDAEADMEAVMEMVRAVRNIRSEKKVPPGKEVPAIIHADEKGLALVKKAEGYLKVLAKIGDLELVPMGAAKPERAVTAVAGGVELYLPLAGLVDIEQEIARLKKELEETEQEIARARGQAGQRGICKQGSR